MRYPRTRTTRPGRLEYRRLEPLFFVMLVLVVEAAAAADDDDDVVNERLTVLPMAASDAFFAFFKGSVAAVLAPAFGAAAAFLGTAIGCGVVVGESVAVFVAVGDAVIIVEKGAGVNVGVDVVVGDVVDALRLVTPLLPPASFLPDSFFGCCFGGVCLRFRRRCRFLTALPVFTMEGDRVELDGAGDVTAVVGLGEVIGATVLLPVVFTGGLEGAAVFVGDEVIR